MFQTLLTSFPWLTITFHKAPVWVWIALPLLFLITFTLGWLVMRMVIAGLARSQRARKRLQPLAIPLALLIAAVLFEMANGLLPLGRKLTRELIPVTIGLHTFAVTWLLFRLADLAALRMQDVLLARGRRSVGAIIPLLRKIGKATIAILGLLFLLQNFGLNVAAIIAGLGIGGVALALASQKSVENLLGGIMLALDQPVRVGDFCRYGDGKTGTVEDIGLRSTRIRLLDKSLMIIPNKTVAADTITNLSRFTGRRVEQVLGLTYASRPEQLEELVAAIRALLEGQPEVEPKSVQVAFRDLSASSLDVWLAYEARDPDFRRWLQLRQEVNLALLRLVAARGLTFAYPTQTLDVAGAVLDRLAARPGPAR